VLLVQVVSLLQALPPPPLLLPLEVVQPSVHSKQRAQEDPVDAHPSSGPLSSCYMLMAVVPQL
jgi:hypothetical protein